MWVAIVLLILYLIFNILSEEQTYKKRYIFDDLLKNNDKISMNIRGEFESSLEGENSDSIILKHVRLYENSSYNFKMLNNAYLPAIIIYVNDIPKDINIIFLNKFFLVICGKLLPRKKVNGVKRKILYSASIFHV